MTKADPKIIVALDFATTQEALALVEQLSPQQCRLKIGKELFTIAGPEFVKQLQQMGFQIFLDLKFHDIPATVGRACAAAAELGVWMLNVHAMGGRKMMQEAAQAVQGSQTKLIAVTVLTSMDATDLHELGIEESVEERVNKLAALSQEAGLDGVVCSAKEVSMLRKTCGKDFLLVTPGIRPQWAVSDDQKRILTPSQALAQGVSYMVIGRPVTRADDPKAALQKIRVEIGEC